MPGDGEEHPAVVRVGDHDGAVAGEEAAMEDEVDPLAGGDQGDGGRIVEPPDGVREHPRGIDHRPGGDRMRLAGLLVAEEGAGHQAVLLRQGLGLEIVDRQPDKVRAGAGEGHGQAGVVELAVLVDHPAAEA